MGLLPCTCAQVHLNQDGAESELFGNMVLLCGARQLQACDLKAHLMSALPPYHCGLCMSTLSLDCPYSFISHPLWPRSQDLTPPVFLFSSSLSLPLLTWPHPVSSLITCVEVHVLCLSPLVPSSGPSAVLGPILPPCSLGSHTQVCVTSVVVEFPLP